MRTIKLIGALLVFFACGYMGMLVAQSFARRPRDLMRFVTALQLLETEIQYARTSLPEAFRKVAHQCKEPVATFFHQAADKLGEGTVLSAQEAWEQAIPSLDHGAFTSEDVQAIKALGSVLGRSDAEDQCKHIKLLQQQLDLNVSQAEDDKKKNVRLWNYLGFCVGALVIILLF